MKISFVELQNFRKLKCCHIDFSNNETIFVGANNSGKTSAMDALILFLKDKSNFKTQDFTLTNWSEINSIGKQWINRKEKEPIDYKLEEWHKLLPQLDVWLEVEDNEIHYVNHLIPTLDWNGGKLGVRLILTPENIETLHDDFCKKHHHSKKIKGKSKVKLWPTDMWSFLDEKLLTYFKIEAHILDPSKLKKDTPQELPIDSTPLETSNPFKGLIRIDIINAQRGFTDSNDNNISTITLSSQLREYYSKHLDPSKDPTDNDIEALEALETAKKTFDENLKKSFSTSLKELETLNYPGFGNPSITLSSKVSTIDGINHPSAVRFDVLKPNGTDDFSLPESYNGLGYQNLISMVFKLIRFRDNWMQIGKSLSDATTELEESIFEPLHLVLVEEPEAHLHAQAQQVFIRRAYEILRDTESLNDTQFKTQLIVSTHSNHIAHEVEFTSLRYFKRERGDGENKIPTSTVVNLSETFGKGDDTSKFVARYLKTTHCNLFFADATILVEGSAERILVPHFIRNDYKKLSSSYVSILEIGGSHAHKLKPLIDDLGIICLVVTDLDSVNLDPVNKKRKAIFPELGKGYKTGNTTLESWHPKIDDFDELVNLSDDKKISKNSLVRVSYQTSIKIDISKENEKENIEIVYPYTFEDSLGFTNMEYFKNNEGNGFIRKLNKEFNSENDLKIIANNLFDYLRDNSRVKAEFALDLLFVEDPKKLITPQYISDGLLWLEEKLNSNN